jgi:3-hydroxybutyryl-CoA dehydrogenase
VIREIKTVCIVGGGLMGRQIALNTACYEGYTVQLTDRFPEVLGNVDEWRKEYLAGRIAKGKMTQVQTEQIRARMTITADLENAVRGADLVIECIFENKEEKIALFKKLDEMVGEDVILVTNSSYMPSSEFAGAVRNPARLANLHYFNPALVMQLTEVVQGPHTSPETVEALMDFSRKTGKSPIHIKKEIDGFVANRILRAVRNEAYYLVEQGVATAQEIDIAVEKGLNYPMGPFRLQDLTGLDLALQIAQNIYDETGRKPVGYDLIKKKVEAGELGRKSGTGWYEYK